MSAVVSILLWLGVISPGTYTQSEIDQACIRNSAVVNLIAQNPWLMRCSDRIDDDELVIIVKPSEGD